MKRSFLIFAILTMGCGKNAAESAAGVNSEDAVVEASLGSVSGMVDEQAGESYAHFQSSADQRMYARVQNLILPQAEAQALCNRAVFATCASGVRRADYTDCNLGLASTLNGYVELDYSQSACTMASTGDSVTRTYNLQLEGPRGGVADITSAASSDYRNQSYGGGGRLTKTTTGYDVDILGKHIALSFRGRALYDVSVRTLATMNITGSLARSGRTLDGGQLEVNHNLAAFSAVIQPHNLQWSAGCCYPSSGSVDIAYSGSKTGSATLTFNGCGTGRLSNGTSQRTVELKYCE